MFHNPSNLRNDLIYIGKLIERYSKHQTKSFIAMVLIYTYRWCVDA